MEDFEYVETVRVLKVKYLPPTKTKPARIKITDPRLKEAATIGFHTWAGSMRLEATQVACNYLASQKWSCVGRNSFAGVVIVTDPPTKSLKR